MINRRGAVLPLVLLVLSAMALVGGAVLESGWRLERAGTEALHREAAAVARLGGLARLLRIAVSSGVPQLPEPGGDAVAWPPDASTVDAKWWRTHPLVAGVDWHAAGGPTSQVAGSGVRQLLWIAPPPWPLRWDPVAGVSSWPDGRTWRERVAPLRPWCRQLGNNATADLASDRWGCLFVDPAKAPAYLRVRGLVMIDGPLHLTGDWEVTGLLVSVGPIRVTGGRLRVEGGVVGEPDPTSVPIPGLEIRPERSAVDRALALAGRPIRAPFHLRHRLP